MNAFTLPGLLSAVLSSGGTPTPTPTPSPIIAFDSDTEIYSVTNAGSFPGATWQWYYTSTSHAIGGATSSTLTHAAAVTGGALGNTLFVVANGDTAHPSNSLFVQEIPEVYADFFFPDLDGKYLNGEFIDFPGGAATGPFITLADVVPGSVSTAAAQAWKGYTDTGSTHDLFLGVSDSLERNATGDLHGASVFQGSLGSGGYTTEFTFPLANLTGDAASAIPFTVAGNNYNGFYGYACALKATVQGTFTTDYALTLSQDGYSTGAAQTINFAASGPNVVLEVDHNWSSGYDRVKINGIEPPTTGLYVKGQGFPINSGGSQLLTESGSGPGIWGTGGQPPLDTPLASRIRYLELLPSYFVNLVYDWAAPTSGVGAILEGSLEYAGTMANIEYAVSDNATGSIIIPFASQATNGDGTADFGGIDFAGVTATSVTLLYRNAADHTQYGSDNLGYVPDRRAPRIGINISNGTVNEARPFVNLAISRWDFNNPDGAAPDISVYCDANLNPIEIPAEYPTVSRSVATLIPDDGFTGTVPITVTYDGEGLGHLVFVGTNIVHTTNGIATADIGPNPSNNELRVFLESVNPADPPRNFVVKETVSPPEGTIYSGSTDLNSRFGTLRYMDMQNTNANAVVTLANRAKTTDAGIFGLDGYPIEYLVAYANICQRDPWFCVPWNADDDYIQWMAEYVRDNLDPGLVAYFENSNEVWNFIFDVTHQAYDEGVALGLTSPVRQMYAIRYMHIMPIIGAVFAGQMDRIVRVQCGQSVDTATITDSLNYLDSWTLTDGIGCAPYMSIDDVLMPALSATPTAPELTAWFAAANPAKIDEQMILWRAWRAVADSYPNKLRLVSYEDGGSNYGYSNTQLNALNSDARIGDLWYDYFSAKSVTGDSQNQLCDINIRFGLLPNQYQAISAWPRSVALNQLMIDWGQIT